MKEELFMKLVYGARKCHNNSMLKKDCTKMYDCSSIKKLAIAGVRHG
jgi:hypothetical protein